MAIRFRPIIISDLDEIDELFAAFPDDSPESRALQHERDALVEEAFEQSAREERHAKSIARALRQGVRQFRLGKRGPVAFVVRVDRRRSVAVIERPVRKLTGAQGQRLKRPRVERVQSEVPFRKLFSVA